MQWRQAGVRGVKFRARRLPVTRLPPGEIFVTFITIIIVMIIFTIFTQLRVTRAPPGGNRHRHHNHLHWHGHLDCHYCHHYIAAGNKALRSPQSTARKIVIIIIFMTVIIYLLLALFWLSTFSIETVYLEMPGKKRDCLENSERKLGKEKVFSKVGNARQIRGVTVWGSVDHFWSLADHHWWFTDHSTDQPILRVRSRYA